MYSRVSGQSSHVIHTFSWPYYTLLKYMTFSNQEISWTYSIDYGLTNLVNTKQRGVINTWYDKCLWYANNRERLHLRIEWRHVCVHAIRSGLVKREIHEATWNKVYQDFGMFNSLTDSRSNKSLSSCLLFTLMSNT